MTQFIKAHLTRKREYFIVGFFVAIVVVMTVGFVLGQQNGHVNSDVAVNHSVASHKTSHEEATSSMVAKANGDQNNKGEG
ncbi:hypothetical protein [Fructobacillus parabroussonetiae]|uniref:Uncharacterized protein n=1 Tax=Fructobacillus parabroussonetiae TaxID=2713174 RepID=A0ABS5QXH6_9LACO|nr:hypothetical protein [Fructobacillus parabroussonetiae]MBS9337911.1 hypothetical protein [Fructobacillus parabroussonetiae]MCK8616893.1 hypothetical protein [Fructobacillus parabroussonetiae]